MKKSPKLKVWFDTNAEAAAFIKYFEMQLTDTRIDTIEQCARLVERWHEWDDRPPSLETVAAVIRKLKRST